MSSAGSTLRGQRRGLAGRGGVPLGELPESAGARPWRPIWTRSSSRPARRFGVMRQGGRVVLVSSTAGQRGEAFHADYAATKGALISLTKSLAIEYAPDITVNCVAPGWVDTEMSRSGVRRRRTRAHRSHHSARPHPAARRISPGRSSSSAAISRATSRAKSSTSTGEASFVDDPRPMIHLLFTGGTISMQRDAGGGGQRAGPTAARRWLRWHRGIERIAPFRIEDWATLPACHLGPDRLWALRERVREVAESGEVTGIVITHGTDILEETAYLLDRTLDPKVPVALTGAMRTSSDTGWDGPRNLRDAAAVAASTASRGRGAVVVFNGEIFAGRTATKTHATDIAAFSAPHAGPIGRVERGRVDLYLGRRGPAASRSSRTSLAARVALVPMVVGDDGRMLDLARPGHDGVVIEAFGSGNLPPGAVPAIRRWLDEEKPVVLATRCPLGEVTPFVRLRGRWRPARGDGRDTRGSAHAIAGADGADDRALRGRALRPAMSIPARFEIPDEALEIARTLDAAGHEAWCVGGALRDSPPRRPSFGLSTSPPRPGPRRCAGSSAVRQQSGSSTARSACWTGIGFSTRSPPFGATCLPTGAMPWWSTASRWRRISPGGTSPSMRSRTIRSAVSGAIPYGGAEDLDRRVVRAVGDPAERFREDYLRVLRAVRFAARFDFAIDPATWEAARAAASGLARLSAERVRDEWVKGLDTAQDPTELVRLWIRGGRREGLAPGAACVPGPVDRHAARARPRDPVRLTALFASEPVRRAAVVSRRATPRPHGQVRSSAVLPPPRTAPRQRFGGGWRRSAPPPTIWCAMHLLRHGVEPAWAPGVRAVRERGDPVSRSQLAIDGRDVQALGITGPPRRRRPRRAARPGPRRSIAQHP